MQLYAVNFIPLLGSLYVFRVFYTPIIRSTICNCIYSHWYKPQWETWQDQAQTLEQVKVLHIKRIAAFNSCGIQIDIAKVTSKWRVIVLRIREFLISDIRREVNPQLPNDIYSYLCSTALLTSRCCILYIIQQIHLQNSLNMLHNLLFFSSKCRLFHNANYFGSCVIHI